MSAPADPAPAGAGGLAARRREARVTWIGHATVLLDLDGVRVVTDPVLRAQLLHLRRRGSAVDRASLGRIDAVLLSHLHLDHVDLRSLRAIGTDTPVLAPAGAGPFLERRGFGDVRELAVGETADVGPVRVTAVPAEHDGRRHPLGAEAESVGYVIEGTRRAYFAGDTELFDGMGALGAGLDLALLPVWGWGPSLGPGHLDPEQAAQAVALLGPRVAVPIHWGTFFPVGLHRVRPELLEDPPHRFAEAVRRLAPGVAVRVLEPGDSLDLDAPPDLAAPAPER